MSDTSAPIDLVTVWCEIPVTDLEQIQSKRNRF